MMMNTFLPIRWRKLSTLEFDRDRKSMSVICAPLREATPSASQGVQTRRSARAGSATNGGGANVLLVKGAAECLLARSSKVRRNFSWTPLIDRGGECYWKILSRTRHITIFQIVWDLEADTLFGDDETMGKTKGSVSPTTATLRNSNTKALPAQGLCCRFIGFQGHLLLHAWQQRARRCVTPAA